MADAGRLPNDPHPLTWSDALQRLPDDAPEATAWPAMAARLAARDARRTRRRRVLWGGGMALAASLALLAIAPQLRTPAAVPAPAAPAVAVAATPADATPAAAMAEAMPVAAAPPTVAPASLREPHMPAASDAARRPRPTRIATAVPRAVPARADASPALSPATGDAVDLATLYATSRELEALLVATRDPRVASGPAAALASEYDAALATIDARLANPDLGREEQLALWQARVATLREATGFETSQRVLAARGDTYDGALVRVD